MAGSKHTLQEDLRQRLSHQLFEFLPANVAVINRDYRVVLSNDQFNRQFGEPAGRRCYEIYKHRHELCEGCVAQQTFRDGYVRSGEEEGFDREGRLIRYVVRHSPLYDDEGRIAHVLKVSHDVTQETAGRLAYDTLFEEVPCYVAVIDRDLRIVRANRLLRETFGEADGAFCYEVYKDRRSECPECPVLKSFETGQPQSSQQVGTQQSGEPRHYVVSAVPLGHGSEPEHILEMSVDVTEQVRLERERMRQERLALAGETVAEVAHGIKNILTGVQGGVRKIRTGQQRGQPERLDKGIEMLDRNYVRLKLLTGSLLNLARAHVPELTPVCPNGLIQEICLQYREAASRVGVSLSCEVTEGVPEIFLDLEDMHTGLSNMVSNAIDACIAARKPDCSISVKTYTAKGHVVFEVSDTGCGMEPEVRARVFDVFYSTKGVGGNGLGLAVVRKIVEEHSGSLDLQSEPGQGSVFQIHLPIEEVDP